MRLSDAQIDALLAEDLPAGDLTTRALAIGDQPGRMRIKARQNLVVCGLDEASRLLSRLGVAVTFAAKTGAVEREGALLLQAEGPAAALLAGWKKAQSVMEWASGIATRTRDIVSAARASSPQIAVLCTRKSVPFTRQLSLKAVIAGGGEVHRLGLSDTIMVFPEHRAFLGCTSDFKSYISLIKTRMPERAVMVEVTSEDGALAAAEAMADVIQLEKFKPEAIARVVKGIQKRSGGRPIIAAAGGIDAENASDYAVSGADALVTSAPFYAKPVEIQVRIEPA